MVQAICWFILIFFLVVNSNYIAIDHHHRDPNCPEKNGELQIIHKHINKKYKFLHFYIFQSNTNYMNESFSKQLSYQKKKNSEETIIMESLWE